MCAKVNIEQILNNVDEYYSAKVQTYGASPQGVDWNSMESQTLRFKQILKVCEGNSGLHHSILDYGCGYGAMADFILANRYQLEYEGLDISAEMIREARLCPPTMDPNRFHLGPIQGLKADYVVASGIFNVKQGCSENTWQEYVVDTIEKMASMSRLGFSYNILTSYSDEDRKRSDLHYADPCWHFDWCKRTFSRQVSLLHDYGLYEFTILVKYDKPNDTIGASK